ncbi:MAG: 4-phosphoerythronate dehydrogenase [Chitinispirillaceae bacterium]|nr:4-phosphoerythronate dehydrogenase [Chitinispirillaceae bacterium]
MKIVIDENIPFAEKLFSQFGEIELLPGRSITSNHLKNADALIVRSVTKVNRELLEGTKVKFVGSATTGIDHVDLKYLEENFIGFAYAPGSNAESVAEYILSAICLISKEHKKKPKDFTIGIIGVGNIGSRVFKYASLLGMRALLCDPPKKRITKSNIYLPLEEVLKESDIITLHVPYTTVGEDKTDNMVEKSFLSRMKKGASFVNTSRGKIVNENDLIANRDKIDKLVVDVWCNEPAINIDLLKLCDIATPHIAGYSYEGKVRGSIAIYEALCAYFFKEPKKILIEELLTPSSEKETIDIIDREDPILYAILQAYNIEKDSKEMKKIVSLNKKDVPFFFDNLRRNYPRRREFSSYAIDVKALTKKEIEILKELGFILLT